MEHPGVPFATGRSITEHWNSRTEHPRSVFSTSLATICQNGTGGTLNSSWAAKRGQARRRYPRARLPSKYRSSGPFHPSLFITPLMRALSPVLCLLSGTWSRSAKIASCDWTRRKLLLDVLQQVHPWIILQARVLLYLCLLPELARER